MARTIQNVAQVVAKEFTPLYDELTTSDLQACVGLAVADHLNGAEASEAENLALELIHQAISAKGANKAR